MPLTKFTGATNTIQSLADRPNQTDGLTAAQLKIKFDQFAIDANEYLNDTLTEEIETDFATKLETVKKTGDETIAGVKTFSSSPIVPTPTTNFQTSTKKYVDDTTASVVLGQIPDRSLLAIKIEEDVLTETEMANDMKKDITGGITAFDTFGSHVAENATETVKGHIQLATQAEVTAGTDTNKAVTPATAKVELDKKIPKSILTAQGDLIGASGANTPVRIAKGTAFQYLRMNASATGQEYATLPTGVQIASGTFADTTTSVNASATYTKTIPLGFSATKGRLILERSTNTGAIVFFDTVLNNATSINSSSNNVQFENKGLDAKVTQAMIDNGGNIQIQDCYISGTNLTIIFKNNGGTANTLNIGFCKWEVEG